MKSFTAYAVATATKHLGTIRARTKAEAEEIAWEKAEYPSLCHHCAHELDCDEFHSIELEEEAAHAPQEKGES